MVKELNLNCILCKLRRYAVGRLGCFAVLMLLLLLLLLLPNLEKEGKKKEMKRTGSVLS